jgi:hypothetical protein
MQNPVMATIGTELVASRSARTTGSPEATITPEQRYGGEAKQRSPIGQSSFFISIS